VHLVGFTIEIYYDARSYKRQKTFRHKAFGNIVSGGRVPFTAVLFASVNFAFSLPHVATQETATLAVIACVCWSVLPDSSQVSGFCFNTVSKWSLKGETSQAFA
jgi:hypothetical protein